MAAARWRAAAASQADWAALFARYRETPEVRLVNFDMTLEGFKGIFWWGIHRLLARAVGFVFLLPHLFFRRKTREAPRLEAWRIFLLGALQGAMGWIMVKSGLIDDPKVNPVRLSLHLGLALAIFSAELWLALELLSPRKAVAQALRWRCPSSSSPWRSRAAWSPVCAPGTRTTPSRS